LEALTLKFNCQNNINYLIIPGVCHQPRPLQAVAKASRQGVFGESCDSVTESPLSPKTPWLLTLATGYSL